MVHDESYLMYTRGILLSLCIFKVGEFKQGSGGAGTRDGKEIVCVFYLAG